MLTVMSEQPYMHKIGYSYTPLCEFCEDNDETDRDGTFPLETASHILYSCPKYMNIRADIYHERFTDENMIFNKNFNHNSKRLIKLFLRTECLSRKPELTKADLSPKRPNKGKKRKKDLLHNNVNNQAKQTKLTRFLNKK